MQQKEAKKLIKLLDKTPAQTDYEGVRVTVPKKELPAPPDRTELNIVNKNIADGKKVAETLKQANDTFADKSTKQNLEKYKEALKLINKDNVAYVCTNFPNIADCIDDVFFKGAGFDKDEVYEYVLKPLIEEASEHGYDISQYCQPNDLMKMCVLIIKKSVKLMISIRTNALKHRKSLMKQISFLQKSLI